MLSLTAQIYYASNNSIRTLATVELAKNTRMDSGAQVSKDVQVTIPMDAPRTSLIGVVSETVRLTYYSYDYSYYYPYYGDYSSFGYSYYPYYYYMYPSYGYADMTDESLAPLSYIRATTPEYVSLQSEYQMLQAKLNQTQAENQQLQQTVKSQQDSINEKNSIIADLNQQLASAQSMLTMLEVVAVVLVLVVVATAVYLSRRTTKRAEARTSPAESAEA
jgi:hypothetical protein